MSITEFGFSVDEFQNPKNYKNAEAIATLLSRLLLLEPGTIQSHPDMGVGLYSKYHYSVEGSVGGGFVGSGSRSSSDLMDAVT